LQLCFLGTGASGGIAGRGRSRRRESSLLLQDDVSILLDTGRDFAAQSEGVEMLDAVLLTHSHRDACGGVPQLRTWLSERSQGPIDVYASAATVKVLRRRYARLDHCRFVAVGDGERHRIGRWTASALTVPHARDPEQPTFAWKLRDGATALVYASDLARLTSALRRFCRGSRLVAIDAALWGRRLYSHLTIDEALPELCRWQVERIVLTHIGRSAPAHERLEQEVASLCPRALPAYDGMKLQLD